MTSIEKKMLIVVILLIAALIWNLYSIGKKIDQAGGLRQILIGAGREVRSIQKEIDANE